ncbi:MAG: nuclear transport factor 2 family protein [Deltaproteobacteria bacterium]|nr:nuclear transport factor 2 family protein [Deltaproteobacteria bacterium]
MEGIRDGQMQAALDAHVGARYTQHSTGVADGKEGFMAFFAPFLERNPVRDIRVLRAIEDGPYVFLHAYQSLNDGKAKWVTADMFDTDEDDRVIEHWDVIQEFVEETASGRSMVDGPTEVQDLDETEANKAIVRRFASEVLQAGQIDKVTDFISVTQYDQHNPNVEDGLEGFGKFLQELSASGQSMEYVEVHRLIGQGNFVVLYSRVQLGGEDYAVFDVFRLEGGKIVEHWDVQEKISPKEMWNNSGKF